MSDEQQTPSPDQTPTEPQVQDQTPAQPQAQPEDQVQDQTPAEPAAQDQPESPAAVAPAASPRPVPAAPRPTPGPPARRPAPPAAPAAPAGAGPSEPQGPDTAPLAPPAADDSARAAAAAEFGRVDDEGTVWVRTADGERAVGSYPGAPADQALAYFARKYDDLVASVDLFEQRLRGTDMAAKDIDQGLAHLREAVAEPHAVGDLAALSARVEALGPVAEQRRTEVREARLKAREELRAVRTGIVEEAEQIASVPAEKTQWRTDSARMKELFETWRTQQKEGHRLDRKAEEELWKRFSHARTAFDRKRRTHFSQLETQHSAVKAVKEQLVSEAEALQTSTDWGATASAYRQLMDQWRAAGRAGRKDDDALWARFRAAQDAFFAARHAAAAQEDESYRANLAVKEELLTEAEALLPVTGGAEGLERAKEQLRSIQERWERAGRVPRADLDRVEQRLHQVEQQVRDAEADRWRRSDPELHARALSTVEQLERSIADLEAERADAEAAGNSRKVAEAEAGLATRREWLAQARQTLAEYGD